MSRSELTVYINELVVEKNVSTQHRTTSLLQQLLLRERLPRKMFVIHHRTKMFTTLVNCTLSVSDRSNI